MTTYWKLTSRSVQGNEKYLNFNLTCNGSRYPVRARKAGDSVELLIGESFDEWAEDHVSRKRLTEGWEKSILIDEEYDEIWGMADDYDEVLSQYDTAVDSLIEGEETLEAVSKALD